MNTAKQGTKKDQIGRTEKATYAAERAIEAKPIALHPDVDPSEQVNKGLKLASAHLHLIGDDVLKAMIVFMRGEQKRRDEASRATAPKVDSTVQIIGGAKSLIGLQGKVVEVRKSRVAVRLPGRADVALAFSDVEVQS